MKHLYEKDKQEFKIQFGQYINKTRSDDPSKYISGLLRNLIHGRKKLPCLIFDNADHFSIEFQERVFQFARSIFEKEVCVVIMPITDKTSWQLSRQNAFQSFESEALMLPTPPARAVIEKRIKFVLKKMEISQPRERDTYFFGKGIRIEFSNLPKFVSALQEIFLNSAKTSSWIGALSNNDIRRALELSRAMINSPHIAFDDAFKSYVLGHTIHIGEVNIRRAIVRGRYDIFMGASSKFIHNVFNINSEIETSPLLGLRILQALRDSEIRHGQTRERYISKGDLINYLCATGLERRAIKLWLDALLQRALILNYDPSCVSEETATKLEISPSGELHLHWGSDNYDYLTAMAEVTPIRSLEVFREIQSAYRVQPSYRYLAIIPPLIRYLLAEDRIFCRIPEHESYVGQFELERRLDSIYHKLAN